MATSNLSDRLIVDLGMHRGDDAEFYLRKGFRVLAVEASPQLVEEASTRLRSDIEAGRLTVLNVAVADFEGEIEFFLSDQDLWASTRPDMADRGFGAGGKKITVPCTTLDKILVDYPTPYFVKIDVEGRDRNCVEALGRLSDSPRFVSFEADLTEPDETLTMLSMLESYGYKRFKLVNQAIHSMRRMPNPPLEGQFVDVRFTKHMSGPFGEESPGEWLSLDDVRERYLATIRQQALRIEYSAKGSLLGVPMSRLHRPLMWLYNTPAVSWARVKWAERRGVEVGGWFDIHAGL